MTRTQTVTGRLARIGLTEPAASQHLEALRLPAPAHDPVLRHVAAGADPDAALAGLRGLMDAADDADALRQALAEDEQLVSRLAAVCGASLALADHLRLHPTHWRDLLSSASVPPALTADEAAGRDADSLRIAYRRRLLCIAADDLTDRLSLDAVAAALSDLAAATLQVALRQAGQQLPEQAKRCTLAVIAMGKCGGRELNYVSDVDVVFVHAATEGTTDAAAARAGAQLASALMRICSEATAEGTIWPVDAGLRPEGRSGPLTRTLGSYEAYYRRWASTWEFQALLKARPVAGDSALGREYAAMVETLLWETDGRAGLVDEVHSMRRKVLAHLPAGTAGHELKLGPGGLRDVEFAVQLLQLVHGRGDTSLRGRSTLAALEALTSGGYVGRDDGAALAESYRFLRTLEHLLQLWELRRTHVLPDDETVLRRLGRSLGHRTKPVIGLSSQWLECQREVRRLHEKLFYRPLLGAVAALPGGQLTLTPESARERLTALGYVDPRGALVHLQALTTGTSRRAAIQRQLLPAMLGWFAEGPDPDAALLAFRQVSDRLGSTHWYLQRLRDEGEAAEQLARLLSGSRFATELLLGTPDSVALLGAQDQIAPRSGDALRREVLASMRRHSDPRAAVEAVHTMRRREVGRIAVADVLNVLDVDEVGEALTDVALASLTGALSAATSVVETDRGAELPVRLAVVSMGRLGGHEMGFSSDADVLFVHQPTAGTDERTATTAAQAVAAELRRMLGAAGSGLPLEVDADLRPEGRQGPLVRSLDSYAAYYARWSQPWEAQALLRAEAVVGDSEVGQRFTALIDPLRWPERGLDQHAETEIRRIKARMDAERLPRGVDPASHVKLGPGGLTDVEWTAQLLQLRHAANMPGLRTTRTVAALQAAAAAGLLGASDADDLLAAWRLAQRLRNAVMHVRGRSSDVLPRDGRDLAGVAFLLGRDGGDDQQLIETWRRTARRARSVVDRVFWQQPGRTWPGR